MRRLVLVLALALAPTTQPQYLNAGLLDDAQPRRTRVGGQRLLTQPSAAADPPPPPADGAGIQSGAREAARAAMGASTGAAGQADLSIDERAQLQREKNAAQREEIVSRLAARREPEPHAEQAAPTQDAPSPGGAAAAGWRHDDVTDDARQKQQQVYDNLRKPPATNMAAAMAGDGASSTMADRRAAAAERLAAVRAQNAQRQKDRSEPHLERPPPPPPPLPPPASPVSRSGWYNVDDGGSVAFRSGPNMEARTTAIARPRDLVYAAREPEQFPSWIQTDEGLWLPKTFLVPVTVPPSDLQMERAHAAHTAHHLR